MCFFLGRTWRGIGAKNKKQKLTCELIELAKLGTLGVMRLWGNELIYLLSFSSWGQPILQYQKV